MGKTRNFFKKFGDTKGIREHVPLVGTIKDRCIKDQKNQGVLRTGDKNTHKNCLKKKKVLMSRIMTIVWSQI